MSVKMNSNIKPIGVQQMSQGQLTNHNPQLSVKEATPSTEVLARLTRKLYYMQLSAPEQAPVVRLPLPQEVNDQPDESKRCHNRCSFGCKEKHPLRKCQMFTPIKQAYTKESYVSTRLLKSDSMGFCAAGVNIKCGNSILFLKEFRYGHLKFNFPGGGRECIQTGSNIKTETHLQTASSELLEELGDLVEGGRENKALQTISKRILDSDFDKLYWSGESKFVLIWITIDEELKEQLIPAESPQPGAEASGFEWVEATYFKRSLFHRFTYSFIEEIYRTPYIDDKS